MTSIFFVKKIGISGVFVGSVVAYICTAWIEWYYLYKIAFNKSVIIFIIKYLFYLIVTLLIAFGVNIFCNMLDTQNMFVNVVIRFIASALIPNIIILVLFFRTKQFKSVINYAKNIFRRKKQ